MLNPFGGTIFNFFGTCTRWTLYGIKRTFTNDRPISFKEFLNGPTKSDDFFDSYGHELNNKWIGFVTIVLIAFALMKLEYIFHLLIASF